MYLIIPDTSVSMKASFNGWVPQMSDLAQVWAPLGGGWRPCSHGHLNMPWDGCLRKNKFKSMARLMAFWFGRCVCGGGGSSTRLVGINANFGFTCCSYRMHVSSKRGQKFVLCFHHQNQSLLLLFKCYKIYLEIFNLPEINIDWSAFIMLAVI